MPGYRRPYDKGNLYIKFEIEFPPNNFIPCDKISVSIFGVNCIFRLITLSLLMIYTTTDKISENIASEFTIK